MEWTAVACDEVGYDGGNNRLSFLVHRGHEDGVPCEVIDEQEAELEICGLWEIHEIHRDNLHGRTSFIYMGGEDGSTLALELVLATDGARGDELLNIPNHSGPIVVSHDLTVGASESEVTTEGRVVKEFEDGFAERGWDSEAGAIDMLILWTGARGREVELECVGIRVDGIVVALRDELTLLLLGV